MKVSWIPSLTFWTQAGTICLLLASLAASHLFSIFDLPLNPNPNLTLITVLETLIKFTFQRSRVHTKLRKKEGQREEKMLPVNVIRLLWFILCVSISIPAAVHSRRQDSIYEVLKDNGLPMGLLPKGVKEFTVDEAGQFEVHLDQACNAKFESELHYDRNVSGTLSYGQIRGLSGISAQELFLWFQVKGIRVDVPSSGLIYFDVGVARKQFSLSLFETPRECVTAGDVTAEEIETGRLIAAQAISESQSGELRYRLDEENFGSNVL